MQFRYSCSRKSLSALALRASVIASLLCAPALPVTLDTPAQETQPSVKASVDPRTIVLKKFFARLHCPVSELAEEFIHAADDNHLDWRLLPSISVIESGGGKAYKNNNIFGWNNGSEPFPTICAGLHEVAYNLGRSPLYRNHDSLGKLHVYNHDGAYASNVLSLMKRISPSENLIPTQQVF